VRGEEQGEDGKGQCLFFSRKSPWSEGLGFNESALSVFSGEATNSRNFYRASYNVSLFCLSAALLLIRKWIDKSIKN
jgi:hypothetical protein